MELGELKVMPDMERDDELDGYAYPEEYRNKLFVFKDQYIYIRQNAYDTMPKSLIDNLLIMLFEAKMPKLDIPEMPDLSEYFTRADLDTILTNKFSTMDASIEQHMEEIRSHGISADAVKEVVSQCMAGHTNREVEEFIDRINGRLADLDIELRDKINEVPSFELYDTLQKRVEEVNATINERIDNTKVSGGLGLDDVKSIINKELETVRANMQQIIQEEFAKRPTEVSVVPAGGGKVSLGTLVALKEAGYSVDEIKQMRNDGLV